jgi:hypothetical protein
MVKVLYCWIDQLTTSHWFSSNVFDFFVLISWWQVQSTPLPKNRDMDEKSTGTPVEKPQEIVTPYAKLQLAAWKRAEQANKAAPSEPPSAPWLSLAKSFPHQ